MEKNNMVKFRIFYVNADNQQVNVFESKAESREAAYKIYLEYKDITKADGETYYYKIVNTYSVINKDGSVDEYESLSDMINEKKSYKNFATKIKNAIENVSIYIHAKMYKLKRIKYFYDDVVYWLKNYDPVTSTSHMRSELWSIDCHILNDLAFNIDRLQSYIKNRNCGMSDRWLLKARKTLKEQNESYEVPKDILDCYGYTDEEFKLGAEMWCEELDKFLHTIGLYNFFSAYGHFSDDEYKKYHMFANVEYYKKLIPVHEGTLDDIDYVKLNELQQKYWNDIWDWIKENGRELWT